MNKVATANITTTVVSAGTTVEVNEQAVAIDTTTPGGKLVFHIFGALAEFERNIIRERTKAGLEAARSRGRKGGRPKKEAQAAEPTAAPVQVLRKKLRGLESLEERIDGCLNMARTMDAEDLSSVISHLRRARNEVVWKLGE